jgi:hypothetical protein
MKQFEPLPDDPGGMFILDSMDANAENWILTQAGDYYTGAVAVYRRGEVEGQPVIALEWPGRYNKTDKPTKVRLFIAPEDAIGLAETLLHSAAWLRNYQPDPVTQDELHRRD